MDRIGEHHDEMWDEEDGFFYDVLRLPDGDGDPAEGPLDGGPAAALREHDLRGGHASTRHPRLMELIALFRKRHPEVIAQVAPTRRGLHRLRRTPAALAAHRETKLERVLGYLLDENEFLGPYGIRSLSRFHLDHPFVFHVGGQEHRVSYLPAESNTGMFGGNSNWRGPVWMPVNVLIVRGLLNLYGFYGDDFTVECPTGSGQPHDALRGGAGDLAAACRASSCATTSGRRPVYGGSAKFQDDPHWRDLILFYEYFHGDNGAGLGASHQTGWTGLIARSAGPLRPRRGRGRAGDAQGDGSRSAWSGSRWAATS